MPRTIEGGEPEQFLVLDATMSALADAGLALDSLKQNRVEVVIGRGNYFNRGNLTRLQHGRMIDQTLSILAALHPEWSAADLEAIRSDLRSSLPPFESATVPGQLTILEAAQTSWISKTLGLTLQNKLTARLLIGTLPEPVIMTQATTTDRKAHV